MGALSLKIKSKTGQYVIKDLTENETVGSLKAKISSLTMIPVELINILIGYPPHPLELSENDITLSNSKIFNGDTLIVDQKTTKELSTVAVATSTVIQPNDGDEISEKLRENIEAIQEAYTTGILLKKVVPSDNSCLFTSIGYVLNGKIDTDCALFMRKIIAEHVANDKETYNEGVLGKPNTDYCDWIKRLDTWGGAIEVSILSNYYGIEIAVVDITNGIINRFGEDKNYGLRVFLLFDGIHYDALYLELLDSDKPKTMFDINDEDVYRQASQLSMEAKSSRQFTDVEKFTLKCIQCDTFLTGKNGAHEHAKQTGHTNFGEV